MYIQINRRCDGCDGLFQPAMRDIMRGYGRFCSTDCSNKHRIHPRTAQFVTLACTYCKNEFERRKKKRISSRSGLFFCSRKCKDAAQRLESGVIEIQPPHYSDGSASYRKIARRHFENQCNRCLYVEHPEVLVVHHKDRNRSNNDPTNLEILCPTCHATEHFLAGDGWFTRTATA